MLRWAFLLLFSILTKEVLQSQQLQVDTLIWNGRAEQYINLVILGDGYVEGEMQKFRNDALSFSQALFQESPFSVYRNHFNVIAIEVISKESGASHPGTAIDVSEPAHPISTVDNFFGARFDAFGIHRLVDIAFPNKVNTVLAQHFPLFDQVFILVNSPYYGGSGGPRPVATTHSASDEIAIHEMGHSFAQLADEYWAGDQYAFERPNLTRETDTTQVKWRNWLGSNGIGIYQHCCGGLSAEWYRPHNNCKMRFLGVPFCAVCRQQLVERIHQLTDAIQEIEPDTPTVTLPNDSLLFRLSLLRPVPNSLDVRWILQSATGDSVLASADSLWLQSGLLEEGQYLLQAAVHDTSAFLRVDGHAELHLEVAVWTLNKASTSIRLNQPVSRKIDIRLFPNPATDRLTLESPGAKEIRGQIFSADGRLLLTFHCEGQSDCTINLPESPDHLLFLQLEVDGIQISKTVIR